MSSFIFDVMEDLSVVEGFMFEGADPIFLYAAAVPLLVKVLSWIKIGGARRREDGGKPQKTVWRILKWLRLAAAIAGIGVGIGVGVVFKGFSTILPSMLFLFIGSRLTGRPHFSKDTFIALVTMMGLLFTMSIPVDHADVLVSTYAEADTARTIEEAVSKTHDGATIRVLPGTYPGSAYLKKSVIFTGLGSAPDSTIIDGDLYITADVRIQKVRVTGDLIVGSSFLGGVLQDVTIDGEVHYYGTHPFMSFTVHNGCKVGGKAVTIDTVWDGVAAAAANGTEDDLKKELKTHTTPWVRVITTGLEWVNTSAHWMVILTGWVKTFWTEYGQHWVAVGFEYGQWAVLFLTTKCQSFFCGAVGISSICPEVPDPNLHYAGELLYGYVTHFVMYLFSVLFAFATETLPVVLYTVCGVYFSASQYTQIVLHLVSLLGTLFLLYSGDSTQLLSANRMKILFYLSTQMHKFIPVGVEYLFSFFILISSWTVLPFLLPFVDYYVTLCVVHVFLPLQSISTLLKRVDGGKHKESWGWWTALFTVRGVMLLYPGQALVGLTAFYMLLRNKGGKEAGNELKEKKEQ